MFAVIEHAHRRIRVLGATAHPTTSWITQAAKNPVIDLKDTGCRARFMIRDRDGKFPALFDAGIEVVLSGIRIPRMNSIMEQWIQSCRHELLDRTLIWNQRHLLHALQEYEQFHNSLDLIKASPTPAPCTHCLHQSPTRCRSLISTYADATDWAAPSTSTDMPHDLRG